MKIFKHASGTKFIISKTSDSSVEFYKEGHQELPMELFISRDGIHIKYSVRFKDGWNPPNLAKAVRYYNNDPVAEMFTIASEMLITRIEYEERRKNATERLNEFFNNLPDVD